MLINTQRFFSTIVLVFCFLQITFGGGEKSVAWSVISSIVGYWLPSPIEEKKK
jgi:hypothetical protein